jgi:hypothetical protein
MPTWEWIEGALKVAIVILAVRQSRPETPISIFSGHRSEDPRSDASRAWLGDWGWGGDAGCDSDSCDFGGGD